MANNKKLKGFGVKDILHFLAKEKKREKVIKKSPVELPPQEYPINHAARLRHPDQQSFIIDSIIDHGKGCKTYRLRKNDGKTPALFRSGQYLVVRQIIDGKLISRPISISSGIDEALHGFIDLTIKENNNGYFSPYVISHWKIGDSVNTSGPQGNFYYTSLRDEHHVIAIAGGSGITPILSMAKSIVSKDEDFILDVIYCCKNIEEAFAFEQLKACADACNAIHIHLCLEKKDPLAAFSGFVSADMIKEISKGKPYSLFACGPQGLYRHLDMVAKQLGLDHKHYRKEIFGTHKDPFLLPGYRLIQTDRPLNAVVHMCGKDYEIALNPNETIITALERAGIAGPNRCRGGVCGYCRSKLLKGEVYIPMDTDGRRAHDKEKNYIHPCSCFPLTDLELEVPEA